MSFREFLGKLEESKEIIKIKKPVSKKEDACSIMDQLDGKPVLFEKIKESKFRVAGNVYANKELMAKALGIKREEIILRMLNALKNKKAPEIVENALCKEVVEKNVDLNELPILFHFPKDGGNYVSSGVIIAKDEKLGENVSFHRCMQLDKKRFSVRILPRHLNEFIKRNGGELEVALCVGNSAEVSLAGATSVSLGENELHIANALKKFNVTETFNGILVPADTEFVLEGRILKEEMKEGPFVDLTGTYDIERMQSVFEVKRITHRKNAIWHALIPGGLEHKLLMGMPREPTIFRKVNKEVKCTGVNISTGGCNWLHAIVQIEKENSDDGKKAIEAAFQGHSSLKHAFIVDNDIDIFKPEEIEWALATRFQADKNLVVKENEKGSSLDPSADPNTRKTTKVGFDLTIPFDKNKEDFVKARGKKVNLKKFLK